jgi:hypothetical protein
MLRQMSVNEILYTIIGKCKKSHGCHELCCFSISLGYVRVLVFYYVRLVFTASWNSNKDTPSSQWRYSPNCALASCLPPPQCSVISGQLPVVTVHKSSSILLHHIFQSFPGPSNWLYSSKLSFKHFRRNSCAFYPLDVSCPLKPLTLQRGGI